MMIEGEDIHGDLADPLAECVAELARRLGPPMDPARLAMLPRDVTGRLPGHQAEAALELADLPYEPRSLRKLPVRGSEYPALVEFAPGDFAILLDSNETDVLVWRPFVAEAWTARSAFAGQPITRFLAVFGNPDALRDDEAPWHAKGRGHWFWGELRKERGALYPVLVASTVINLLAVALPLFTMNVYDRVIPNRAGATLWVLAIGVVVAFGLEFMLRRARTAVVDEASHRLDLKYSQKIYSRLLAGPLGSQRGHTGALAARVSEYATVRDFFASTTVVLIVDVFFLFIFVGVMAIIAGWLALVPMVIMGAMAVAGFFLQRKVVDAARDAQADAGLQQTLLVESLAGMETLKSMSGEGGMIGRWRKLAEIGSQSQMRLRSINSLAIGLAQTFQQVSSVALVIGGYYLFASGQISMGAIIAVVMLASRSLAPAGQIAFLLTRGRQAKETLASIERLFEGEDERRKGGNLVLSPISRPVIRFDRTAFRYPTAPQSALEGLDLTINPGERIAVVGRVASGKSTFGRLLCGLYEPTDGAILIDGIDSREYRPQQLRDAFRYVGQDAAIFTGSVKENLALGKREANDARLIAALRATGADQFLSRDEGGFDRAVGESGRSLSGGQRAFLSLARAMVTPCELLFLDEPTGAMDSQTESLFVERLSHSLTDGQTLIVSTHRPALFGLCDRLIVLDNGRIVADGPLQEVVARLGSGRTTSVSIMTIEAIIPSAPAVPGTRLPAVAVLAAALVSGLGASSFALPESPVKAAVPVSQTLREQIAVMSTGVDQSLVNVGDTAIERNALIPLSASPVARMGGFTEIARSAPGYGMALKCLTQAIYYEAANEPERGKRGVAQVVLNRVRHPAYPNSVCGVVYEGANARVCQFSFTCDGALLRTPMARQWDESRRIAAEALGGAVEPEVGTATNYHADYVVPRWAFTLGKITQIGRHIFYRLPGSVGSPRYFADQWTGIERIPQLDFNRLRLALARPSDVGGESPAVEYVPGLTVTPEVSDRHAPVDVGGRLDVTTTWRMTIPDPAEISGGYRRSLSTQGDAAPAATASATVSATPDRIGA